MSEQVESEWKTLSEDFQKIEKIHDEYAQKMRQMSSIQASAQKALKHHNYLMKNFRDSLKRTQAEDLSQEELERIGKIRQEIEVSNFKLKDMEAELPAQDNGFYLNLILGSNLNVSLLTKTERFKYKQEYEEFKWRITILITVLTSISYLWPFRVMDSILCFLMVWYYCTLTIRESVLRVNGSKIKGWWLTHHYLSCAVPGMVLTWKDGQCYQEFRPMFMAFVVYISLVQLAQNQYQSGCLRRLHALGQGHQMDITVEGFTSWQFKGLTFLLPFLMSGYIFQLGLSYKLYGWIAQEKCEGLWQVWALAVLLGIIAAGNIITTSLVCLKKLKTSPSYTHIKSLTRKYSSRHRFGNGAQQQQQQQTDKEHQQEKTTGGLRGSNLNVSLLTKTERFKYKQEYEEFKWRITILITVLTSISYLWPFRVMDSILCFLMVWYYCTLTIRESVLRVNGSKIKGWWLTHHYLSCAVPGMVLTWKDGQCYQEFRPMFMAFVVYISLVQLAQNQYQSGCLRHLHALGQGHQMDITVEGFTSWQFKGLTFLLPFLMSGYIFQLGLSYKLYGWIAQEKCEGLWQVWALAVLLGIIAAGNIITTSLVCLKKLKTSPSYTHIKSLTRKYSSRHRFGNGAQQQQQQQVDKEHQQ